MALTLTGVTPPDSASPSESLINPPVFEDVHVAGLYRFLMESLRTADEQQETRALERFFTGPDELWARWQQKAWRATKLQHPSLTPDLFVSHLLVLVGFGTGSGNAKAAADKLSTANKRKLAKLAVSFWTHRSRRDGLDAAIRFVTGMRPAIDTWFDIRTILGEAIVGEEGSPVDTWLIWASRIARDAEPSPGTNDDWAEHHVSLRVPGIVGDSERQTLVQDLCELARSLGERYEIAFVDFLDAFYDGVQSWWVSKTVTPAQHSPGVSSADPSATPIKLPGMSLPAGSWQSLEFQSSGTWDNYLATMLLKLAATAVVHVRLRSQIGSPSVDGYYVSIDVVAGTLALIRQIAVAEAGLALVSVPMGASTYSLRLECSGTNLRVYWNGALAIDVTDAQWPTGTVEVRNFGPVTVEVQRVEVFRFPLTSVLLTP